VQLNIFCDGGARGNPGPAASAFIVREETGKILHQQGFYLGVATNNQAEYQAVLEAMKWIVKNHSESEISFFLDSLLVVNQLSGKFKVKDSVLKIKYLEINGLIKNLKLRIKIFTYLPRSQNFLADKIVNETLDTQ